MERENETIKKIVAIVRISELKREIKDREEKVAKLEQKYKKLRDEWYNRSGHTYAELSKKMNGVHLGLCSANEKLGRLKAELYKIGYENPDLEDLFY